MRVDGEDRYEFTQSMVREVVYEGLSRHRRRHMHLRAGEALEQVYGTQQKERAGELADHFLEAGEEKRAIPYCVMAGELAEALFAHDEAVKRFETARELQEDAGNTEEAMRLLERLGAPYLHMGQAQTAIKRYQEALEHYEAQNLKLKVAELRRKIGHVYQVSWDFGSAIPVLEQALQEFGDEAGHDVLMLYLDLARAYNFAGEPERGITWANKALELANAFGTIDEAAIAHVEIGLANLNLMKFDEAETHNHEVIRLARESKSYLGKSALRRSINNLAVLEQLRGNFATGLDLRKKALAIAEEVRDLGGIAFALQAVGGQLRDLGEWQSAGACYKKILAFGEGAAIHLRRASISLQFLDEDWEGALENLRADLTVAERRRDTQAALVDLIHMADAALLLERYGEAEQYARRGSEMSFPAPFWSWPTVLNYLAESLVHHRGFANP